MTEPEVQTKLTQFIIDWNGKQASYEGYTGTCLSLAKQWVDTLAGNQCAPASGSGFSDGYFDNFPSPLNEFFSKVPFDGNVSYPSGGLIVYPATHHIAIVVKSTAGATTTEVFEQNANPNNSPAHVFNRLNSNGSIVATGVLVPIVENPPVDNHIGQMLNLSASVSKWHVYPLGVEPVLRNALSSTLNPAKFNGLSYRILANPYPNTYTIQTQMFGVVNIFADSDSSIN